MPYSDHHQHQGHSTDDTITPKKPPKLTFSSNTDLKSPRILFRERDRHHDPDHHVKLVKTVPNTPRADESPLLSSAMTPNPKSLSRMRSLGKIDIRSPVLKSSFMHTPGGISNFDLHADEANSLRTTRTNDSIKSRFLGMVQETFNPVRNFYNDFTTIDWTRAYLRSNEFNYSLEKNRWTGDAFEEKEGLPISWYQKVYYTMGRWILIVLVGFFFSIIAFGIDKVEILLVGFKHGYCRTNWFASQMSCCLNEQKDVQVFQNASQETCDDWISWNSLIDGNWLVRIRFDFIIYVSLSVILAIFACLITLTTKITGGSVSESHKNDDKEVFSPYESKNGLVKPRVIYTATGSGVPEVKTILSGFVIRRFLGTYTLVAKTIALIFAIALGMSLGKEGPYVHLATCVGNITSRYFWFIFRNDFFEKQILSASASAGVALAFGSPLGGVLFILEEINNHLPSNQLFQIFFCAIISTLFLKFLNPYGTGKTVLFELDYFSDWTPIELIFFIMIGIAGGIFGALFVKFVHWWPKKFRTLKPIKNHPVFEVFLVSALTGIVTFWNPYTKQASAELVLDLATPCTGRELDRSLCPTTKNQLVKELGSLIFAFLVKVILTFVTFGLKVPCGIYVPSMVCGALFGRIFAMFIQLLQVITKPDDSTTTSLFGFVCSPTSTNCVDMGIYAMISAGAFMAGVTRMNITLVTILFELTSSYTYVLPIAIAIAVANWAGSLLEKNSLYESLLISNDYPFTSPETEPIDPYVTAADIVNHGIIIPTTIISAHVPQDKQLYIDISDSNYVSVTLLESKLHLLADRSLLDGCVSLLKNSICVGLVYFLELEMSLDKIKLFALQYDIKDEIYCKIFHDDEITRQLANIHLCHNEKVIKAILNQQQDYFSYGSLNNEQEYLDLVLIVENLTNLVKIVDTKPIFLNHDTDLCLANLIFDRVGNRVIVLIKKGKYYGVLHKKVLIDYLRRVEE
ncbi:H(+)/Cl(-) exchange transporter 5 [Candida viswanathii]|uniref:H(+)/Cl(-) exchange transporter 5 n=1 Tax=Candida viswanathii TaxID=5486 RepID=A0A367Y129_9ASCO|nr:H(+)/Cl(-) exchange transporter 5 [Candida viswanathii]